MFVAIALDPGSEERARELADLLARYGFEKVQRGLWESALVAAASLERLKRDIDRATDAYDRVRIYQYPVDGVLVVSGMREKKWRRLVARIPTPAPEALRPPQIALKGVLKGIHKVALKGSPKGAPKGGR